MATRRLHVVYLFEKSEAHAAWMGIQIRAANTVFAPAGIGFAVHETIIRPFRHGVCRVGSCDMAIAGTADQRALFDDVAPDIPADDIVVFVAKSIMPDSSAGCAWHPTKRLGCVVAASEDTGDPAYMLAHELGHVLGLPHDEQDSDRLMFPSIGWTNPPPELSSEDLALLVGQRKDGLATRDSHPISAKSSKPFDLRFELEKITPNLSKVCRRGSSIVPDLISIYKTSAHQQVRARALCVLLRLRADDVDELVASAVESCDLPVRLAIAYQLTASADTRWSNFIDRLRKDVDSAVCLLASESSNLDDAGTQITTKSKGTYAD